MSVARLVVIQHEDPCPPGWFEPWLTEAGLTLDVVAAHRGDPVPDSLGDAAGLLVLGGQMGAGDDATVPWLPATKALIARTVAAGQPLLGICLGHQLATAALGGAVERNPHGRARGLTPVRLTAAGRADELLAGFDAAPAIQWNGDVAVQLPPGAVELATAPDGTTQAARFGPRAWGVQFHPEASPGIFRGWALGQGAPLPAAWVLDAVRAVEAAEARLRATWARLAARFATVVRGLGAPAR